MSKVRTGAKVGASAKKRSGSYTKNSPPKKASGYVAGTANSGTGNASLDKGVSRLSKYRG